jgi:phasin
MAEANFKSKPAKAAEPVTPLHELPKYTTPKFEIPNFELPKMEVPAAFREFAERGVEQTKQTYEKIKAAAEQATDVMETSYTAASKGTADYGLKVIELTRANTNAYFDFVEQLFGVKSLSEAVELSTAHTRKQFETLTAQTKELAALAQKVAAETTEPLKAGVSKAMQKVA